MQTRNIIIRVEISKEYIQCTLPEHALKTFKEVGVDLHKHRPADLIAHMGITTHRWHKILNKKSDVLLREAVAYCDYWHSRGKIDSLEDLFIRVD